MKAEDKTRGWRVDPLYSRFLMIIWEWFSSQTQTNSSFQETTLGQGRLGGWTSHFLPRGYFASDWEEYPSWNLEKDKSLNCPKMAFPVTRVLRWSTANGIDFANTPDCALNWRGERIRSVNGCSGDGFKVHQRKGQILQEALAWAPYQPGPTWH